MLLARAALAIGLLIVVQGMVGMFRPEAFLGLVLGGFIVYATWPQRRS